MNEYTVIERTEASGLAFDVVQAMRQGWHPLGGVTVAYDYRRAALVYAQAMVKP